MKIRGIEVTELDTIDVWYDEGGPVLYGRTADGRSVVYRLSMLEAAVVSRRLLGHVTTHLMSDGEDAA